VVQQYGRDYHPIVTVRGQKYYTKSRVERLLNHYRPHGKLVYQNIDPNPVLKLNRLAEEGKIKKSKIHVKTDDVRTFRENKRSSEFINNWLIREERR
jgi:hypothetical protein